jgi:hypothetical protein
VNNYFAAADREEIGRKLFTKVEDHESHLLTSSVNDRLRRAYLYYFGYDGVGQHVTSQMTRSGDVGELAKLRVNFARAHVQTLFNLTTAPKVVWTPVAAKYDSLSQREAILAANILEYYWIDKDVWQYFARAVEEAIAFTEGFVFTPWDTYSGEAASVDPDTGELVKNGDFRFINLSSWDVIRDPRKKAWDRLDWVILRVPENRYTLAAQYPEHAQAILEHADYNLRAEDGRPREDREPADDVLVYYFYHKRTTALPAGRETLFLGPDTVLSDDALQYDEWPIHRVAPAELTGTPYGYSQFMEVLGIQELVDSLESAAATNQDTFATQMIAVQRSEPFNPVELGGMRVLEYSDKPPVALNLTATPPEVFKNIEAKKADMQRIMGLNDAVSGNLPPGGKLSGAALALLSTQATQNNSQLQANYVRAIRSCGSCLLSTFQKKATTERKITLSGRGSGYLHRQETFTRDSIKRVKSVLVDIGNPLQQTASGRIELANLYAQHGVRLQPDQIVQVISTGRLDPLIQNTQKEQLLILDENEAITSGQTPVALIHDDHLLHGKEHRNPVTSVEARKNPALLKAAMDHLHQHYKLYWNWPPPGFMPPVDPVTGQPDPAFDPEDPTLDPFYRERMLILVGQQPPMSAPPAGAPPGPGAPPPADAGAVVGQDATPSNADMPNMPSMPTNPVTGNEYNPQDGGGQIPS